MGMQEIRSELDDLCFKILEPGIRDSIIQRLNLLRNQDENILKPTIIKLNELFDKHKVKCQISGREKNHILYGKKCKIKSINFLQLSDIMAFKIIVEDVNKIATMP